MVPPVVRAEPLARQVAIDLAAKSPVAAATVTAQATVATTGPVAAVAVVAVLAVLAVLPEAPNSVVGPGSPRSHHDFPSPGSAKASRARRSTVASRTSFAPCRRRTPRASLSTW